MGAAILLLNVVRQYGRLRDTAEVWGGTMPPEVCRVELSCTIVFGNFRAHTSEVIRVICYVFEQAMENQSPG